MSSALDPQGDALLLLSRHPSAVGLVLSDKFAFGQVLGWLPSFLNIGLDYSVQIIPRGGFADMSILCFLLALRQEHMCR